MWPRPEGCTGCCVRLRLGRGCSVRRPDEFGSTLLAEAVAFKSLKTACKRGEDQCWGAASKQLRRNFKLNPRIHVHKTIDPTTLRRVTKLHEIYSSISVDLSWSDRDLRVNNHLVCVGRRNAAAGHPLRSQGESGPVSQAAGIDGQLVNWTK